MPLIESTWAAVGAARQRSFSGWGARSKRSSPLCRQESRVSCDKLLRKLAGQDHHRITANLGRYQQLVCCRLSSVRSSTLPGRLVAFVVLAASSPHPCAAGFPQAEIMRELADQVLPRTWLSVLIPRRLVGPGLRSPEAEQGSVDRKPGATEAGVRTPS